MRNEEKVLNKFDNADPYTAAAIWLLHSTCQHSIERR
jgi:hypothetical protein